MDKPIKTLSAEQLREKLKLNPLLKILDVREIDEVKEGYIDGAENVPLSELSLDKVRVAFGLKYNQEFSEDDEIVIYCRAGFRSLEAIKQLYAQGLESTLSNLDDGIIAWAQKGYFIARD